MKPSPVRIDVSRQELEDVLERVRETLGEQDYEKLKAAIETLAYLTDDATACSMLALLKYGSGLPFYRMENLQESLEIPLPASTQWEVVASGAAGMQPALEELIRQATQGEVLHNNDDTPMPVLGLERERDREARDPPERKGVFTSGIVATQAGRRVALFFTGHRHAGENLASVLARRAQELAQPI